jgi:hypothetical protein
MNDSYKLQQLREQWKLAKTDIDRAIIEARASLIKRGYQTLEDKQEIKLAKDVKNTLY